jgi:YfiH family protein
MRALTLNHLTIAFGDAQTGFETRQFVGASQKELLVAPEVKPLFTTLGCTQILVLQQIHSTVGYAFVSPQTCATYRPYAWQGDYLATSVPGVGIAVATADCLPVVLSDPRHQAVSVVHAGWRGSVAEVSVAALHQMQAVFGTVPADVSVYFGPAARVCCYEVQQNIVAELADWTVADCLKECLGKLFLDVPLLNELQLVRAGVQKENIAWDSCGCTICGFGLCSYRRDGAAAKRQMTVAVLR